MVRVTCKLLEESASSDRFSKEEQEERRKDGNLFNICVYQFERLKNSVQLLWFKNEVRHDESRRSPEELEEIVKAVEDLRKKLLACVLSGTKDDALSWTSNFMECMTLAGFRSSEELEEPYDEHFEAKMRSVAMVKAEEEESLHSVFIVADEEKDGRDPVELPPPPYATDYGRELCLKFCTSYENFFHREATMVSSSSNLEKSNGGMDNGEGLRSEPEKQDMNEGSSSRNLGTQIIPSAEIDKQRVAMMTECLGLAKDVRYLCVRGKPTGKTKKKKKATTSKPCESTAENCELMNETGINKQFFESAFASIRSGRRFRATQATQTEGSEELSSTVAAEDQAHISEDVSHNVPAETLCVDSDEVTEEEQTKDQEEVSPTEHAETQVVDSDEVTTEEQTHDPKEVSPPVHAETQFVNSEDVTAHQQTTEQVDASATRPEETKTADSDNVSSTMTAEQPQKENSPEEDPDGEEESGGDAKKDEENRRGSTGNLVEEDEMEEPFENGATTRGVFHEAGENDSVAVVGDEESLDVNADRQPETVDETSTEDEEEQVSSCIHEMHLKHYQKAVQEMLNSPAPEKFTEKDIKKGGVKAVVKYIQHLLRGNIDSFLLDMKLYQPGNEEGACLYSEDLRTVIEEVKGQYNFKTVLIKPSKPCDRLGNVQYPSKEWDGSSYPIPEEQQGDYPDPRTNGETNMKFITVKAPDGKYEFYFTVETVDFMVKMMKDHFQALLQDLEKNKGKVSRGQKDWKRKNTFIYIHVMSLLFPGLSFNLIKNLGAYKYVNRPEFITRNLEFFERDGGFHQKIYNTSLRVFEEEVSADCSGSASEKSTKKYLKKIPKVNNSWSRMRTFARYHAGESYTKTEVRKLLNKGNNEKVSKWTYPIFKKRFKIFGEQFEEGTSLFQQAGYLNDINSKKGRKASELEDATASVQVNSTSSGGSHTERSSVQQTPTPSKAGRASKLRFHKGVGIPKSLKKGGPSISKSSLRGQKGKGKKKESVEQPSEKEESDGTDEAAESARSLSAKKNNKRKREECEDSFENSENRKLSSKKMKKNKQRVISSEDEEVEDSEKVAKRGKRSTWKKDRKIRGGDSGEEEEDEDSAEGAKRGRRSTGKNKRKSRRGDSGEEEEDEDSDEGGEKRGKSSTGKNGRQGRRRDSSEDEEAEDWDEGGGKLGKRSTGKKDRHGRRGDSSAEEEAESEEEGAERVRRSKKTNKKKSKRGDSSSEEEDSEESGERGRISRAKKKEKRKREESSSEEESEGSEEAEVNGRMSKAKKKKSNRSEETSDEDSDDELTAKICAVLAKVLPKFNRPAEGKRKNSRIERKKKK